MYKKAIAHCKIQAQVKYCKSPAVNMFVGNRNFGLTKRFYGAAQTNNECNGQFIRGADFL